MRALAVLLAGGCIAPLLTLLWLGAGVAADGAGGTFGWRFSPSIAAFLPDYLLNSALLALGAGALALAIGCYAAWFVTRYAFPFRRTLEWALLLPLAMPAYLLAMVYGHLLDVAGPVQAGLRAVFQTQGASDWFPPVRSLGGAVCVLAFTLYPYVYLLAREAFARQCRLPFDAAWLLGVPPQRWLWRVAIPVARPALVAGVALVMMETLADFGVVSLFGVPSFTTGIYRAWYGLGDPHQAARLALLLLALVLGALALERASRRRMARSDAPAQPVAAIRFSVSPARGWFYCAACALPVIIGFVLPVTQLLFWAARAGEGWADPLHWRAAWQGGLIALLSALLCVGVAALFAYRLRAHPPGWLRGLLRLAGIGYAIPGSVIAVAIFLPLLQLDKTLADAWQVLTDTRPGLLLTGSIAAIVLACTIRFLAVALAGMEAGLAQISRLGDDAARLLGARDAARLRELHWPLLRPFALAAGFMVFADTLKELPATLLLRPFDVTTLSIRSYELASDGRLVQASVPALLLVGIGLLAVLVLVRVQRSEDRS